jgi:hypothetical protein
VNFSPISKRAAARRSSRLLKGSYQLPKIIEGVKFTDGIEVIDQDQHVAS